MGNEPIGRWDKLGLVLVVIKGDARFDIPTTIKIRQSVENTEKLLNSIKNLTQSEFEELIIKKAVIFNGKAEVNKSLDAFRSKLRRELKHYQIPVTQGGLAAIQTMIRLVAQRLLNPPNGHDRIVLGFHGKAAVSYLRGANGGIIHMEDPVMRKLKDDLGANFDIPSIPLVQSWYPTGMALV